ncbi:MAG: pyridoxal phosphate-dependent aminotransferase [Acidobacteriota bacterium]
MGKPSSYREVVFRPTLWNRIEAEAKRRSEGGQPPYMLHIGDTWLDLPKELFEPLEYEPWAQMLSRYGSTQGQIELRDRLATKLRLRNRLPVQGPEQVQITYGATGGLFLVLHGILEKDSEVLTLCPFWPILRTLAAWANVRLIEVPFFDRITTAADEVDIEAILRPFLTDRTSAVYFNYPNNPCGVFLRPGHLEQIARFAAKNDLWIISDEAYEDFVWVDEPFVSTGALPGAFDRTISVFTFSKSYAAAGLRLGCITGQLGVVATLNPLNVATGYEPGRLAQVQWIRALERHDAIVSRLRQAYRDGLRAVETNLKVPYLRPEGSFYVFVDLRERWKGLDESQKMSRMIEAGVVLAPGEAFGAAYDGWARFCYTALPPEEIGKAAQRVNRL